MTAYPEITENIARKVLDLVDQGLTNGLGSPEPGKMCVEAAVCFALGLPHGDNPPCVSPAVRAFKIKLNDGSWSSDKARATGMRKLAIAQLGSDGIDDVVFVKELTLATIRRLVSMAIRSAAKIHPDKNYQATLEDHAVKCESAADYAAARAAARAADRAAAHAAAGAAARAAASADYAAAGAAAGAAHAAASADYAAAHAAAGAAASAAAGAAASAAAGAAARADYAAADEVLTLMAEIGIEALRKANAPGIKWLSLLEAA